jgi:hypothetical protein
MWSVLHVDYPLRFSTLLIYDIFVRVSVGYTDGGLSCRIIIWGVEGGIGAGRVREYK